MATLKLNSYTIRTDGLLSAAVDECFDWVSVDFYWHAVALGVAQLLPHLLQVRYSLKHRYTAKGLRGVFQRVLQVLQDGLLPDGFLYPPLRLHIERISVHGLDRGLVLDMARPGLSEKLREPSRVILRRVCDLGLVLLRGIQSEERDIREREKARTACSCRMSSGSPSNWRRIISASCSSVLCRITVQQRVPAQGGAGTHRPATETFLRRRSMA